MTLLDQVTNKIKEMKEAGIALASIKASIDGEVIEIVVGRIEARDIFEPGKDSVPGKKMVDEDYDLYHVD